MSDKPSPTTTEVFSVSTSTAAKLLGVAPPTLDKDRRIGHLGIPHIKAGRRVLYVLSDLQEWLNAHKRNPASKEGSL